MTTTPTPIEAIQERAKRFNVRITESQDSDYAYSAHGSVYDINAFLSAIRQQCDACVIRTDGVYFTLRANATPTPIATTPATSLVFVRNSERGEMIRANDADVVGYNVWNFFAQNANGTSRYLGEDCDGIGLAIERDGELYMMAKNELYVIAEDDAPTPIATVRMTPDAFIAEFGLDHAKAQGRGVCHTDGTDTIEIYDHELAARMSLAGYDVEYLETPSGIRYYIKHRADGDHLLKAIDASNN